MADKIKILSTSDLHGYIYPYSYADGSSVNNGLARISTLIASLRDENTILIDNGDVLEGSPFTFFHYQKYPNEVNPVSLIMKKIGFDYVNIGNHDFNYGKKALDNHLKNCGAQCLTANILYQGNALGPDDVIREVAGKRLAFFAVTTQHIPNWEEPQNIKGFTFPDAYKTADRIVKLIKEKEQADYIVCIYHGGFEKDPQSGEALEADSGENEGYKMISRIDGIDILIAGHQHATFCGKAFHTAYTEPGAHGSLLSCFTIDTDSGEITSELIKCEAEADPEIIDMCKEREQEVQQWLDTPLGYTPKDLRNHDEFLSRFKKSQLATFINKVQFAISGADLSATAIFLHAKGFYLDITMRDVVSTYFFPNTFFVKKINGKILKDYLETTARFWAIKDGRIIIDPLYDFPTPMHHNYDMLDGIEYTIKASKPFGQRIVRLERNGIPVKDEDEFTLIINSYRAAGSGGYDMIKNAPTIKEIQTDAVGIIGNYISREKVIDFEDVHNIDVII